MKKPVAKARALSKPARVPAVEASFGEVVELIRQARQRAFRAINTELIDLYWHIGETICRRIDQDGWGKGTVEALSVFIQKKVPNLRGFSPQNLWRMRQFFETYRDYPKLSTMLRELPWSAHLHILSKAKRPEEREFYLSLATQNGWQVREVARQIDSALFERAILHPPKLSTVLRELHPQAAGFFKEIYQLEFLGLEDGHSEADLHQGLLRNLGRFLTELGRDFCFIGSEYPVQVGSRDFALDLLFFHRGLNCLIAIELKVDEFQPEYLGKLEFYLEALDRDVRKPHERPSIGLLLCKTKDNEVVEYALSRTVSPALISEYQMLLPEKALLRAKLQELYAIATASRDADGLTDAVTKAPAEETKRKRRGSRA
jgi:predicted nuclease of restriction endonuclease-like (RecB) superfamily